MLTISAILGDITEQAVDAVVNPASTAMRGGGGADVDGAIHRAGGAAILEDCIERFPEGLAIGDADWTTASDLPAQWVIHTVGPNYKAGQRNRSLLESCYRRALEVADELGARTVAFPLISTGSFGGPRRDAIAAAIGSIAAANTNVNEVRLVAFDHGTHIQVLRHLEFSTSLRILQGVQVLHQRGYQRLRILPGLSASGMHWRIAITSADNLIDDWKVVELDSAVRYSTGGLTEFAGGEVTVISTPESVADLILNALPENVSRADDPAYVSWFAELIRLVEQSDELPIAYAEYFDGEGWKIGWSSGVRHPRPPKALITTPSKSAPMKSIPSNGPGQ